METKFVTISQKPVFDKELGCFNHRNEDEGGQFLTTYETLCLFVLLVSSKTIILTSRPWSRKTGS
jgi:hypothetical protein